MQGEGPVDLCIVGSVHEAEHILLRQSATKFRKRPNNRVQERSEESE